MVRVLCLVIGYLFGILQTGYFYGKVHNVDLRKSGSGNLGATNSLRVMGIKAALIVFMGDFIKTVIPCMIVKYYFANHNADMAYVYVLYTGFGAMCGHNWPFYLKFKGGKGISVTAGMAFCMDIKIMLSCLLLFILVVFLTRIVSVGSIVAVSALSIIMIVFSINGYFNINKNNIAEFCVLSLVWLAVALFRHKDNIKRLLNGNENKIGKKQS